MHNGNILPGVSGPGREMAEREMPDSQPHQSRGQGRDAESQSAQSLKTGKQKVSAKKGLSGTFAQLGNHIPEARIGDFSGPPAPAA